MQKPYIYLIFIFSILIITSCNNSDGRSFFKPERIDPPSVEDRVALSNAENLGRSSWQKPALIVNKLGDINGKIIADIGSGTGYFTFHLAYLNAKVIAVDIDQQMIQYVDTYKQKLPKEVIPNIETRLADPDNPKLLPGEVDKAIIINTISYIDDLSGYLTTLKPAIKAGGTLLIVDYKNNNLDIASPPLDMLVSTEDLTQSLTKAGYTNIAIDDSSLKYQYIVTAEVE